MSQPESKTDPDSSESKPIHVETVTRGATIWFIGWMFTIGYANQSFGAAVLGILLWPYYVGRAIAGWS